MHRVLTEHPAIVEIDQACEKADRDHEAAETEATRQHAEYREALALASREGLPLPEAPGTDVGQLSRDLWHRKQSLSQQRDQRFAEHAPEMIEQLRAREAELLEEAKPLVQRLGEIADEMGLLVRGVGFLNGRMGYGSPNQVPVFGLTSVDPGILFLAIEHGWGFISEPITPQPSQRAAGRYSITDSAVLR